MTLVRVLPILLAVCLSSGCASLVSNAASGLSDNLTTAILNHDDPETARAGMPSYMLLMDSFVEGSPDDPAMLGAAANLYASYGAVFANNDTQASRLTRRARDYASTAMCSAYAEACNWDSLMFEDFESSLDGVGAANADTLYTYGFTMLAYIRAHTADFNALAELPQGEAILTKYLELAGEDASPAAHTYLGVLKTLRPPALGGEPEEARFHFEKAIDLTGGRDLSAKVEFAKGYAKTMYDRELHDQLVTEVLQADPYADGFTLMNVLAQEEALQLAAAANDYF
mgnify:FL=1